MLHKHTVCQFQHLILAVQILRENVFRHQHQLPLRYHRRVAVALIRQSLFLALFRRTVSHDLTASICDLVRVPRAGPMLSAYSVSAGATSNLTQMSLDGVLPLHCLPSGAMIGLFVFDFLIACTLSYSSTVMIGSWRPFVCVNSISP